MGGFFGIGHLPGESSAQRAKQALTDQAEMYKRWTNDYYEPLLKSLWQQYQQPSSAYQQAQLNQFADKTRREYQAGAQRLQQGLVNRGLGHSSLLANNLGSLWNAYGNAMATARQEVMGRNEAAQQRALAQLMNAVNPGAASGIYQNQLRQANQETGDFINSALQVGDFLGNNNWFGLGKILFPAGASATGQTRAQAAYGPVNPNTYSPFGY